MDVGNDITNFKRDGKYVSRVFFLHGRTYYDVQALPQASNTPRPMSFKNQIADSFHAFSVCIMDYFYNQVSLLKGGITKHKMDKKNIGKRQI